MVILTRKKPLVWSFTGCELCKASRTRKFQVMPRLAKSIDGTTHILFIGSMPNSIEDLIGNPFIGIEGDALGALIANANIPERDCAFTYGALCYSSDPKTDNHLWCLANLKEIVIKLNPAGIVYVGTEARDRYRRGFAAYQSTYITALSVIVKSGGIASPLFLENVNRLRRLADDIAPF